MDSQYILIIVIIVAALVGGLIYWLATKKNKGGSNEKYSTPVQGGKPCGGVGGSVEECGSNGTCVETNPGAKYPVGFCRCAQASPGNPGSANWSGPDCKIGPNKCPDCIHGTCDESTGKCKCDDGWIFDNCSFNTNTNVMENPYLGYTDYNYLNNCVYQDPWLPPCTKPSDCVEGLIPDSGGTPCFCNVDNNKSGDGGSVRTCSFTKGPNTYNTDSEGGEVLRYYAPGDPDHTNYYLPMAFHT